MQLLTLLCAAGVASAAALPQTAGKSAPAGPHTAIPEGVVIEPRLEATPLKDGGIRTTVDYGPYNLPKGGMISVPSVNAKTPCTNCFITGMQAKISYVDGTEANIDTGAWLHHMVIAKIGKNAGPLFASGNERTPLRLNNHYKYGIEMSAGDSFVFLTDLMSAATVDKKVKLQMLYEYIPKEVATGYKNIYMKWNDVGQPAAKEGVYSFATRASSVPVSGKLLYTNGHVHDGGTYTQLYVNGKVVCKSTMLYGRRPGFNEPMADSHGPATGGSDAGHGHTGLHISDSSTCQNFGEITSGSNMHIDAWYDSNKYPLMAHNGKAERLMGIMRVYVGPN